MKCGDAEWDYAVCCREDLGEEGLSTKDSRKGNLYKGGFMQKALTDKWFLQKLLHKEYFAKAFMQSVDLA